MGLVLLFIGGDVMSDLIITVGSVTTAVRLEKKLNAAGVINSAVIHTPPAVNSGGCSYSVRVPYKDLYTVKEVLSDRRVKYKRLYVEDTEDGERVYRALS